MPRAWYGCVATTEGAATRRAGDFLNRINDIRPITLAAGPLALKTPYFVYDGSYSFVRTRGDIYGYEGRYPQTDTYTATLTVTDRAGNTAARTKKVRVTNTPAFPGLRDLIGHINDSGGHRGKLVISEVQIGEVFENSHAEQTVYVSMKERARQRKTSSCTVWG